MSTEVANEGQAAAVRKHFDDLAPLYDNTTQWTRSPELLREAVTPYRDGGSLILDLCCGTGMVGRECERLGNRVVGVDFSSAMLVRARRRLGGVVGADASHLPFRASCLDGVVVRQALHYVEPVGLLSEAHRVLRATGTLVVSASFVPVPAAAELWREFKRFTQPLRGRVFTEAEVSSWLLEAGFALCRRSCGTILRREEVASLARRGVSPPAGWCRWLAGLEADLRRIDPEAGFRTVSGSLEYRQAWITLVARKPPI